MAGNKDRRSLIGSGGFLIQAATARYVRVQLTSNGIALSLAEVRVLVPGSAIQQYYYAGGQRIAQRVLANGGNVLYYLHGDHLGSTSATTCGTGCGTAGALLARQLYYPFGQIRYMTGTLPTDYGYTGQMLDDTGWMYYQARYYDPALARFSSADTIVPSASNPQALNRYSYTLNNPTKFTDPTGHDPWCPGGICPSSNPSAPSGSSVLTVAPVSTPSPTTANTPGPIAVPDPYYNAEKIPPPDFSGGYPPPHPQVEGLPDDSWGWTTKGPRGPGYSNSADPTGAVYRPDRGGPSVNGNEGEDPHWNRSLPGMPRNSRGEDIPENKNWGRGGQRAGPGVYNPETGLYEARSPVPSGSGAGTGILAGGVGFYLLYRAVRAVASLGCGPAAPVCALAP